MPVFPIENQNPLLTVCVVCYNQENSIADTVNSILDQDVESLQLIVSDDASQDKTPEILKEFKEKNPEKIHLILHEKNNGIAGNVDQIHPHIRGKYLCWFDGDDLYLPGKLKAQLDFMEANPDYIASYHDMWVNQTSTGVKYRHHDPYMGNPTFSGDIAREMIIHRCFFSGLTTMIRRDMAKEVKQNPNIPNSADKAYLIELSFHGKIKYIDDVFVVYNRHDRNISRLSVTHENEEKCFEYLEEKYGDKYGEAFKKGRAMFYTMYVFKYLTKRRFKESALMVRKLMPIIAKKPSVIGLLLGKIASSVRQRINLVMKTGRINR